MSDRNGPRDVDNVLAARYWLTDAGMAATNAHWEAVKAGDDDA